MSSFQKHLGGIFLLALFSVTGFAEKKRKPNNVANLDYELKKSERFVSCFDSVGLLNVVITTSIRNSKSVIVGETFQGRGGEPASAVKIQAKGPVKIISVFLNDPSDKSTGGVCALLEKL